MSCIKQKPVQTTQEPPPIPPVFPGPCDPVLGCPPPTEIVCIKVDKVFESCSRSVTDERTVNITPPAGATVTNVECLSAQVVQGPTCVILAGGRVATTFAFTVTIRVTFSTGAVQTLTVGPFTQSHNVPLSRAGEPGLEPQCEVFLFCLDAFVSAVNATTTITLCIGKLIIFKLFAHVQLLVPAFGFCPVPEECEVLGECPEFVAPDVIPYPPQIVNGDDNNG